MVSIAHIILNVSDYKKSKKFYDIIADYLSIKIRQVHNDEHIKIYAYDIPGAPLYIRWVKTEKHQPFSRNVGLDHIAIAVEEKTDVDEIYLLLKKMKTLITRKPQMYPEYNCQYYAFYFRDPDGIPLEIVYK